MAAPTSAPKSLKEYLKRYESNTDEERKKKKKNKKAKPNAASVLVVDEDPVWQKPVNLQEEENDDDSADEVKPQIDEDIEVKRMRRLEQLRLKRPYNAVGEDGSGWVSLSPKCSNLNGQTSDISPPRRGRTRNDTPSPDPDLKTSDADLSPPRIRERRGDSPSPEPSREATTYGKQGSDMSPPRRKRARKDTPSPVANLRKEDSHHSGDLSPPRCEDRHDDISPPRRLRARADTPSPEPNLKRDSAREDNDLSPPRQRRHQHAISLDIKPPSDLSPPRRSHQKSGMAESSDLSPPRRGRRGSQHEDKIKPPPDLDISPPRKGSSVPVESRKTGLISGKDISKEIAEIKKDELLRTNAMDPSLTGKGAEPVYRDRKTGARLSKEEFLKLQEKKKEKPKKKCKKQESAVLYNEVASMIIEAAFNISKSRSASGDKDVNSRTMAKTITIRTRQEINIEWGKGLAQKREAEERMRELEVEKDRPFARTRDDEDLNRMLKERIRWGDPMAHLVKKKQLDPVLPDLGDSEKMKESGFVIPQDIPSHSWLKRGLDAAPNRYGIRPGRHWDGVDRSNGYEKELFKRMNEKHATEREAYLWSVSDM